MSFAELLVWIVPLTLLSFSSPMMVQAAMIRLAGAGLLYWHALS